jgi:hypothetical protein
MSDGCSSPRGHNYQQNAKGEWRCVHCGQQMQSGMSGTPETRRKSL